MANNPITNGELKIWIEGQFELVRERQEFTNGELRTVRQRIHDLSNDVAKNFSSHDKEIDALDTEVTGLKTWKASLAAVKAAYGVGGAFIGGSVAIVLDILKVIHP